MTRLRRVRTAGACCLLLLVGGCARGRGPAGTGPTGTPPPATAVVLRVEYVGGFIAPQASATRLPVLSVYRNGMVLTEGAQPSIYPAPALPNVQLRRISTADVDRLVRLAIAAGVGTATDFGQPPIADAASTRFTVRDAAGVRTTEVYALGESGDGGLGVNDTQRAARARLRSLYDALGDLPATLGAGAVSAVQPYEPAAVAVLARAWTADPQLPGDPREIAWPGPPLPGEPLAGLGQNCVTVTGPVAAQVLSAARSANAATPWTSGGRRWAIAFRPLLPDESGCDDLRA